MTKTLNRARLLNKQLKFFKISFHLINKARSHPTVTNIADNNLCVAKRL